MRRKHFDDRAFVARLIKLEAVQSKICTDEEGLGDGLCHSRSSNCYTICDNQLEVACCNFTESNEACCVCMEFIPSFYSTFTNFDFFASFGAKPNKHASFCGFMSIDISTYGY